MTLPPTYDAISHRRLVVKYLRFLCKGNKRVGSSVTTIRGFGFSCSLVRAAQQRNTHELFCCRVRHRGAGLSSKGDIAILTFLSALEQVEADLGFSIAELGGATNQGLSQIDLPFAAGLALAYITGLLVIDGDTPHVGFCGPRLTNSSHGI